MSTLPGTSGQRRFGLTIGVALAMVTASFGATAPAWASVASGRASTAADAPNVPYTLPVRLPALKASPRVAASGPYTPAVMNLIAQLEPDNPPTKAEISNADRMLVGAKDPTCHNVGTNTAPTGTTPVISPLCWSDGDGINVLSGPNLGRATGSPAIIGLGASFDPRLANAWGQVEGAEGRELMVTGLLGPQADTDVYLNWERDLDTPGEDPFLSGDITAAEVNGMQGSGLMSQVKHLAVYSGQGLNSRTTIQDQALHQQLLPPYQHALVDGGAAAVMCSYQIFQDATSGVPSTGVPTLYTGSPYGKSTTTWPLNQMHYSCEQPLTLTDILRDMWGSKALIGPDYPALHSASAIVQGVDMQPGAVFFGTTNLTLTDPTGDTCANASGKREACTVAGAVHVAGIPGPGCGADGCSVANAAAAHVLPISVFDQALATMLYQEQRFGLLGCNDKTSSCSNPGGVKGNRSGTAPLPAGPTSGPPVIGTWRGDAAISEKMAEEGAVLLKNNDSALPLTAQDLKRGISVTGGGAEYLIANPNNESAVGRPARDAVDPLEQLKALSGVPSAFSYSPAGGATGEAVPPSALSTKSTSVTGGLARTTGPGSPKTDPTLNFTTVSGKGRLARGSYTWTGYVHVPTSDTYTFRFQFSRGVPARDVTFTLDGKPKSLIAAQSFYTGEYYGKVQVPVGVTNAGYTQAGLTNEQCQTANTSALPHVAASKLCPAGKLSAGFHAVKITFDDTTAAPASFRFAYSRTNGDIAAAAAAAKGKAAAIVFANDSGRSIMDGPTTVVSGLPATQVQLIKAVAAVNPNTIVVLNTAQDIVTRPWIGMPHVKAVLEMWNAGQEGGTATARLLLGQANPSGHTPITWPVNGTDTIYGYNQQAPLYPGDTTGTHPGRASVDGSTHYTEGIFNGYRYYDKLQIPVQFPFGFGLSYSTFAFSNLKVVRAPDGGFNVTFTVKNTSSRAGAEVAQVYVGAPSKQPKGIQYAVRSLAQFERVYLPGGKSRTLTEHVGLQAVQHWSPSSQQWVDDTGTRTIYVGDADSLAHLPLRKVVTESAVKNTVCSDEQFSSTTIAGDLDIAPGAWCDLVDVTVTGSVHGARIAGLRVVGSTIRGDVVLSGTESAVDPLSSGADVIAASSIAHDLSITNSSRAASWDIGAGSPVSVGGRFVFRGNGAAGNQFGDVAVGGRVR